MDAYIEKKNGGIRPEQQPAGDDVSELVRWLSVSGDVDDFIYYDDDARACSER